MKWSNSRFLRKYVVANRFGSLGIGPGDYVSYDTKEAGENAGP